MAIRSPERSASSAWPSAARGRRARAFHRVLRANPSCLRRAVSHESISAIASSRHELACPAFHVVSMPALIARTISAQRCNGARACDTTSSGAGAAGVSKTAITATPAPIRVSTMRSPPYPGVVCPTRNTSSALTGTCTTPCGPRRAVQPTSRPAKMMMAMLQALGARTRLTASAAVTPTSTPATRWTARARESYTVGWTTRRTASGAKYGRLCGLAARAASQATPAAIAVLAARTT